MPKSYKVHPKYIQTVTLAWEHKCEGHEQEIARKFGLSLPVVHYFLKGQPVYGLNFLEICQILGLNWREIAGLNLQETQVSYHPELAKPEQVITPQKTAEEVSELDQAINSLVSTLCEMLRRLTRKAGDVLNADRTSIFLLDRNSKKLGTINAEDGAGGSLIIDIPLDRGIASLAAASSEIINIPFDVYDDPRSEEAKKTDKTTGYRTYTILAWPLLDEQQKLVAVVQLINKLKDSYHPNDDLLSRIDNKGFTKQDEELFENFAPSILQTLKRCEFCYRLANKLRKNPVINRGGVSLNNSELIAELKEQEQKLRKSIERIYLSPRWAVPSNQ